MNFQRNLAILTFILRLLLLAFWVGSVAACSSSPDSAAAPTLGPATGQAGGEEPDGADAEDEPNTQPAVPETRRLTLEWPPVVRVGDSDVVLLTLEVDDLGGITPTAVIEGHEIRGETVQIPNVYETHNVVAQARLDLAGVEVQPGEEISEPLRPGSSAAFIWSVRPPEVGRFRGTVWLHLHFVPLDPGGQESRIPLSAQLIELRAINFLGLGGAPARILGGIGALAGSVIGLDSLLPWVFGLVRRRRQTSVE